MGTTLTLDLDEHTEINEVSIKSGAVPTLLEPGMNALDEYDLYGALTVGGTENIDFVVDYADGANFVVAGLNKQSYNHDGNTDAVITFNGETLTFIGYQRQFFFTIGGSTAVYAKALSAPVAAGTYTVTLTPGDWPVGTDFGVFTGYAETAQPAILDSFVYGDNSASSTPLFSVTPGGKPCIAVGVHLDDAPGGFDGCMSVNQAHPYQGTSPCPFQMNFGIITEDWSDPYTYPRTDDRDIGTGSSGVGKRRAVVLVGDDGVAQAPTDDIEISEPRVESAYSDGITVTVE